MSTTAIIGATKTKSLCTQTRFPSENGGILNLPLTAIPKRIKYQIFDMDGRLITGAESGYFKNADADCIMPSIDIKPNTYFNVSIDNIKVTKETFSAGEPNITVAKRKNNCVIKYCK